MEKQEMELVNRQHAVADPGSDPSRANRGKKKSASFFTFQDGLPWHIHALHCYLVQFIVLNFDDNGNLRTTKSIQKVMKSEARLVLLATYTTYPV